MKVSAVFFCLVCLFSCKEISFHEPQPRGKRPLTTFPQTVQGRYLTIKDNGDAATDTIIIHSKGYRVAYFDPIDRNKMEKEEYEEGTLSDSLVLKSFKGYYFLNFREPTHWMLRVLKQEKNGDLIYMAPEQEGVDFKDYIRKISSEVKVDSFQVKDQIVYQIDPSPNELVKLIEKGYFTHAVLKKVK